MVFPELAVAGFVPNSKSNDTVSQDVGLLQLITNTDPIFRELDSHQMSLQAMQSSGAAGSFLDELVKWQKGLQTIEAVLTVWLSVQDKWLQLEEVLTTTVSLFIIFDFIDLVFRCCHMYHICYQVVHIIINFYKIITIVKCVQIFTMADVKTALSHDSHQFAVVNRDFRILMRATEKNPNVLQCCQRKSELINFLHNLLGAISIAGFHCP